MMSFWEKPFFISKINYHRNKLKRLFEQYHRLLRKQPGLGAAPERFSNYESFIAYIANMSKEEILRSEGDRKSEKFSVTLNKLLAEKKISRKEIIAKANINDNSFDQYARGGRNPGREIVLKLCLGMGASVNETNRMLELAGRNRLGTTFDGRDIIIAYCLIHNLDLFECNTMIEHDNTLEILE